MAQRFSCWHSVRSRGINSVCKVLLASFLMAGILFGQTAPAPDKIKKDVVTVQNAINEAVGISLPGWGVLQAPKGAYLEGYGLVVTMEIAFDSPANPFTANKSPEEVRATAAQRRKEVQEKLTNILKQKAGVLDSIAPTESVAIVMNILNTNPAYIPDMPAQIILSVKKQDAATVKFKEYK